MATATKTYIVEDAEKRSDPKTASTPFPGTLEGLLRSARPGTALPPGRRRLWLSSGRQRTVIRRFEGRNEVWTASRAEIRPQRRNGPQG